MTWRKAGQGLLVLAWVVGFSGPSRVAAEGSARANNCDPEVLRSPRLQQRERTESLLTLFGAIAHHGPDVSLDIRRGWLTRAYARLGKSGMSHLGTDKLMRTMLEAVARVSREGDSGWDIVDLWTRLVECEEHGIELIGELGRAADLSALAARWRETLSRGNTARVLSVEEWRSVSLDSVPDEYGIRWLRPEEFGYRRRYQAPRKLDPTGRSHPTAHLVEVKVMQELTSLGGGVLFWGEQDFFRYLRSGPTEQAILNSADLVVLFRGDAGVEAMVVECKRQGKSNSRVRVERQLLGTIHGLKATQPHLPVTRVRVCVGAEPIVTAGPWVLVDGDRSWVVESRVTPWVDVYLPPTTSGF